MTESDDITPEVDELIEIEEEIHDRADVDPENLVPLAERAEDLAVDIDEKLHERRA